MTGSLNQPIVVFDSGVGGLSVLDELVKAFPHQPFIYFGDTANMPYGVKSGDELLALVNHRFKTLIDLYDPHCIVVACNTATAIIEQQNLAFSVPTVGLMKPLLAHADLASMGRLALLATPAMVASGVYQQHIQARCPELTADRFQSFPAETLAWIIEQGGEQRAGFFSELETLLVPVLAWKPDTVLLACTHYPLIREAIQQWFGPCVTLVDPATFLVKALAEELIQTTRLLTVPRFDEKSKPSVVYTVSHDPECFQRIARSFPLPHLSIAEVRLLQPEASTVSHF